MKKRIVLSESKISNMVNEAVKRILNEDTSSDVMDKWYEMRDCNDADFVLDNVFAFFGTDNIKRFLDFAIRYEMVSGWNN